MTDEPRRDRVFMVRLTEAEKAVLYAYARRCGVSASDVVRMLVLRAVEQEASR